MQEQGFSIRAQQEQDGMSMHAGLEAHDHREVGFALSAFLLCI